MRHAKSSWEDAEDDHARPLTDRGRRDAARIAVRLSDLGWIPDRVVSSDAARTLETWARMSGAFGPAAQDGRSIELLTTRRLYHADPDAFCAVLSEQPEHLRTLLVLGHNPGWEGVARRLTGLPIGLSTATAVLMARPADAAWGPSTEPHTWSLVDVLRP